MSDNSESDDENPGESYERQTSEDEVIIPKSCINQIIKSVISQESSSQGHSKRVSSDAREALALYGAVFIRKITDAANEHCKKKTLSHENLIRALDEHGFQDISQQCMSLVESSKATKAAAKSRKKAQKLESLGVPEEELLRQQEALFEQARNEMELLPSDLQSEMSMTEANHVVGADAAMEDYEDFDI